jgi:ADP-heptose:LPS heptosyltransferase
LNPRFWTRLVAVIATLRRRRYGQLIDLELYRPYGVLMKSLLGIGFSRGFLVDGTPRKYHDVEIPYGNKMPEWQCFYLVFGLDVPGSKPNPLYPRQAQPVGSAERRLRVGVVFGSSFNWPQKRWPLEYFVSVIGLLQRMPIQFVLFGSPFERADADKIIAGTSADVVNTAGTLSLEDLQQEVSRCDLVFGNDTGTLHLAAACGVPAITLFGPTDPVKWNALTSTPLYLESVPCRPCYDMASMPACSHFSCLRKMTPESVADQILSALSIGTHSARPVVFHAAGAKSEATRADHADGGQAR